LVQSKNYEHNRRSNDEKLKERSLPHQYSKQLLALTYNDPSLVGNKTAPMILKDSIESKIKTVSFYAKGVPQ
jgi:hypothetical protein